MCSIVCFLLSFRWIELIGKVVARCAEGRDTVLVARLLLWLFLVEILVNVVGNITDIRPPTFDVVRVICHITAYPHNRRFIELFSQSFSATGRLLYLVLGYEH